MQDIGAEKFLGKIPRNSDCLYYGFRQWNRYSKELCGGPHVEDSSKMGTFKITKEQKSNKGGGKIKEVPIK